MCEGIIILENHWEEDNQGGYKGSMDKFHLEGEHTELKENEKKVDITVKKIDAKNVARSDTSTQDCKSSQVEGNVVTFINNDSEEE